MSIYPHCLPISTFSSNNNFQYVPVNMLQNITRQLSLIENHVMSVSLAWTDGSKYYNTQEPWLLLPAAYSC